MSKPFAMPTYAIGDVQGCLEPLLRLLERISFDPERDRLWFCGDLVNRGPDSLGVLRLAKDLGAAGISVLGNHDLHLLARAEGLRPPGERDTMDDVLAAPDRDELLDWLARRPFIHQGSASGDASARFLLVHAGLLPQWSIAEAVRLAGEATLAIRAGRRRFLKTVYEAKPPWKWSDDLEGEERLRCLVAGLVRLRALDATGRMDDDFTGPPSEMPRGHVAWFAARAWKEEEPTVVFGHWAAMGLLLRERVVGLDTGCVWGKSLTALRLEDRAVFQVPARRE